MAHKGQSSPEGSEFELDAWDVEEDLDELNQAFDDPAMPSQQSQSNGRPTLSRQHTPLLETKGQNYASSDHGSPNGYDRTPRSARFKERDPDVAAKNATRKRYIYASFFLVLSLISFCIQTETAVYIQANLGWNKAYAML